MMRTLFLLLLAANLAYAAWVMLKPATAPDGRPAVAAEPHYPATLERVSEYEARQAASVAEASDPLAGLVEAAGVAVATGFVPDEMPADNDDAPAEGADETIVPGEAPAGDPEAAEAPLAASVSRPEPTRCVRIGPFADEASAHQVLERVGEWIPDAALATVQVLVRRNFWVHIPPLASEAEARTVVGELTAQGIDSFVIRDEPGLRNGVSLGVFRDAASAERQAARFVGIGHPVAVHEAESTRSIIVLEGTLAGDIGALHAALQPGTSIDDLACPGALQ